MHILAESADQSCPCCAVVCVHRGQIEKVAEELTKSMTTVTA
jgi:hypothetical protein